MENKKIIRLFKLAAELMELHDENPFKVRSYVNGAATLELVEEPLAGMSQATLESIQGVGKGIAAKIIEINQTGSFAELYQMLAATPPGVVEMLRIKGIGPKKVRTIWKELGTETVEELLDACEQDKLSKLKGFGAKTQENIKQALLFTQQNRGKLLYAEAEPSAEELLQTIKQALPDAKVEVVGDVRRRMEIVESLQFVVGTDTFKEACEKLGKIDVLEQDVKNSGPRIWRGNYSLNGMATEIRLVDDACFANEVVLRSASEAHLTQVFAAGKCMLSVLREENHKTEEDVYHAAGMAYVVPELREGTNELQLAMDNKLPKLLELSDLKGILHNHSTYSDGAHTLEQMATFCRDMGYQYLGISDHSKTASYAGGLREGDVLRQQKEIDELNQKLAPFKIFKGIESDILTDGSLDYEEDILKTFDFIVASVHSVLNMDEKKATQRLITAIENPYTTMLGHPTGRLLLRREGYPINHKMVIDACAANNVIIEINSNPWRLDLDWRHVQYALEKGVMLSINPDAHHTSGYDDMKYGVLVGRKGGLTKEMTFNAKSADEVEAYFNKRKAGI
ncbi:DNA polymerase/3'-5' exonuclease PolX [Pontibacter sp. BT310]|uniref:DNA polymerase/3'-5' exonuclease PolX n=1 Tax=Pontibacter populi TaxID=890055 RepID=A0ABS6X7Q6_9BACT|nr:DNA polymerase/3'-5' exonuclease PolX [Pontibacter populi]MBJ6117058.1 DNA polymerase/3'-5' exonuclease PolX [Pontibacter sp. BT310]MBR0569482.1 DNA polymerase/3'-5' exonuclease PolX [Microvirga sp. STS03]MBW3363911.1 DNA polymerase/3'-5' exonuclease PolX [Pontibacter populi]